MGPIQAQVEYQESLFEKAMSILFPVVLPKIVEEPGDIQVIEEQGSCGKARVRPYRDGIDRMRKGL